MAVAICAIGAAGCGSTIVTRVYSRDILVRSPITQSEKKAWRVEERAGLGSKEWRDPEAAAQALARWAAANPDRLALAAEELLDVPAKGSEQAAGFSLSSLKLAWRSLQLSGIPDSEWLEAATTRRIVAIYNRALDRFVSLKAKQIAGGFSRQDFWTPLGPINVSTEFLARPPYGADYFDTFIPADHVSVRGMGKRIRVQGLGVALVGARYRTPEREAEMLYQPAGEGVFAPFCGCCEVRRGAGHSSSYRTNRSESS